ncbi:MAG: hypothetical protein BWY68_00594 [bacterium ADurb.Bin400]|nr:MAG: hypothetical protein BWY68_00594 [bacterium ADurb.Bin400]
MQCPVLDTYIVLYGEAVSMDSWNSGKKYHVGLFISDIEIQHLRSRIRKRAINVADECGLLLHFFDICDTI